MCTILEEMRAEAAQKATHRAQKEVALRLLEEGSLPHDKIAMCSGLPIEEVEELAVTKTS